jgi:hypothetical protein
MRKTTATNAAPPAVIDGKTGSDPKASGLLAGPVVGRTYSLYGQSPSSDGYFDAVAQAADACLARFPDPPVLVADLARASRSSRSLRRAIARGNSEVASVYQESARRLDPYFLDVDAHRASLSVRNRCSTTLAATREQYLVYAIEIELRNRLNSTAFSRCDTRMALLPHCLRDLEATCAAKPHGFDVVCMACSDACYVNAVSRLLRHHRIQPYVWMSADLSRLLRQEARHPHAVGVLGIACIPELVAGMRRCARAGVPVLGLPLDANRCVRWFGEFRQNTVNLGRLENLVAPSRKENDEG